MGDNDGIAQDGVLAIGGVDGQVAVAEGLARDDVLLQDVEVDEGSFGRALDRRDAPGWRLGDDFGA